MVFLFARLKHCSCCFLSSMAMTSFCLSKKTNQHSRREKMMWVSRQLSFASTSSAWRTSNERFSGRCSYSDFAFWGSVELAEFMILLVVASGDLVMYITVWEHDISAWRGIVFIWKSTTLQYWYLKCVIHQGASRFCFSSNHFFQASFFVVGLANLTAKWIKINNLSLLRKGSSLHSQKHTFKKRRTETQSGVCFLVLFFFFFRKKTNKTKHRPRLRDVSRPKRLIIVSWPVSWRNEYFLIGVLLHFFYHLFIEHTCLFLSYI